MYASAVFRASSLLTLLLLPVALQAAPAAKAPSTSPRMKVISTATEHAYFAMGCFWCGENDFEGRPGIKSVVSGYTGGREKNPTYEQVSSHMTGHF